MSILQFINPIDNDIHQYKIGRYISSNEGGILNFPIHERHPAVI